MKQPPFARDVLALDCAAEVGRIGERLKAIVGGFRKKGLVVALSGGIDSSVTAALAVSALGKERVFGLHMPERDSSPATLELSRSVSTRFGFESAVEDITPILDALGCYRRRDDAIRTVLPEYGPGWRSKIVLPNVVESKGLPFYSVVV